MNGYDVAFVTGMDEHGQKVADTAADKGMTLQDCATHGPRSDAWDMLGITPTSCAPPSATRTVQFWQDHDRGQQGQLRGLVLAHEETYYESDLEKNEDGELVCPDRKPRAEGGENWSSSCPSSATSCWRSTRRTPISSVPKRARTRSCRSKSG